MRAIGRWYLALVAALCSGTAAHTRGGEAIDPIWLAKARTEVKEVSEKYKALAERLDEESEYRMDKVPGSIGKMPFNAHSGRRRVVRLGDNLMCEKIVTWDNEPNKVEIRLQCDNSDYYFTLNKTREDGPYALIEYGPGKRKRPLSQPSLHDGAYYYLNNSLAAIDNHDKYALHKLRFDDAKGLLLVEYTDRAGNQIQTYLDPSHNWRLVELRSETPSGIGTERWSYGITIDGLEFPTECTSLATYKSADFAPNVTLTIRLIRLGITEKTPRDFRLSAFDLPEPIDVAPLPRPTRWYLWIAAATLSAAALSILFAWLKRRHTTKASLSSEAS